MTRALFYRHSGVTRPGVADKAEIEPGAETAGARAIWSPVTDQPEGRRISSTDDQLTVYEAPVVEIFEKAVDQLNQPLI